jgi:hypothetical protein
MAIVVSHRPWRRRSAFVASAAFLAAIGCQSITPPAAPTGATVTVSINPGFRTQAATTDVNHYTASLYEATAGRVHETTVTFAGTTRTVQFNNVGPGTYRAFVEAFASPADDFNVTDVKSGESTAAVSVLDNGTSGTQNLTVNLKLIDPGTKAPGDSPPATTSHSYTTTKNTFTSQWVWIPTFRAYQLINPANCGGKLRFGTADNARPAGYWVASRPSMGMPGTDFDEATLGGFYAGKYEACHEDADSGTNAVGSASALAVKAGVTPWSNIDWPTAALLCRNYHPACRLMRDDDWTALAVWGMVRNLAVDGNTDGANVRDNENVTATFTADANLGTGRAKTGSGPVSSAHDGTVNGVYDLKGNVAEWTSVLDQGVTNWQINDFPTLTAMPTGGSRILTLSALPLFRRLAVPATLDGTGKAEFGGDGYTGGTSGNKAVRGGSFLTAGVAAGIWCLDMSNAPNNSTSTAIGFRPVLRF